MTRFESDIDVDVPVRAAYDQWTQFESFPRFMDGVQSVKQLDDRRLAWIATVGGQELRWTAEIVDQVPDTRIAWRSVSGAHNAGAVLFRPITRDRTAVTLRLEAEPDGAVESVGAGLGFLERQVKGDLRRFKTYVEEQSLSRRGWRGEIHGAEVIPPPGSGRRDGGGAGGTAA